MKERTIGIIRTIKQSNNSPAEFALRDFLCEYTNTIPEDWPFQSLCAVLRDVIAAILQKSRVTLQPVVTLYITNGK